MVVSKYIWVSTILKYVENDLHLFIILSSWTRKNIEVTIFLPSIYYTILVYRQDLHR